MPKNRGDLSSLDLNLLYTFRTFAECGSVQLTAAKLARSQPAISARLHQLQQELGTDLLIRTGRRLELTPLGRVFNTRLAELFSGIHELVDQARAASGAPVGLLRIGALPTAGVFLLTPKIATFTRRYPGVEVEMQYGLVSDLVEGLQKGHLDLVVGVGDKPSGDLDVKVLGFARPVLVTRKGTPDLPRRRLRPAHLTSLSWVGFGQVGDSFFDSVWEFLCEHGIDKRVQVRVANIQTLKALVGAGVGVSILPAYTVVERDLETRTVNGLGFSQPIWMAARPSSLAIPLVAQFRKEVAGLSTARKR